MLNHGPLSDTNPSAAALRGGAQPLPQITLYPEREEPGHHWLDPAESIVRYVVERVGAPIFKLRLRLLQARVLRKANSIASLDDAALSARIETVRGMMHSKGLSNAAIAESFALIREMSRRVLGLYHHPVQVLGGLAMIRGAIAEMETGEGKTLTATLAAGTAALAGLPVHVITVNDYLAERDAETMEPLYARLALSVGVLVHGIPPPERRAIYRRDIVYASNSEMAFDYLRDRVELGGAPRNMHLKLNRAFARSRDVDGLVMRGLHFAIVDEADSVLVDEARTPLILSRESDAAAERVWAETAHKLAKTLFKDRDFTLHMAERRVDLTETGCKTLERIGLSEGNIWTNKIRREQAVRQALSARHLFTNGDQYIIQDGKVMIVDEYTGRIMAERSWNDGMHQLVEVKEGVEVTPRKEVIARLTYQRFFRRYLQLSGMTGTAREVTSELSSVYHLNVVSVPTNTKSRRKRLGARIVRRSEDKWQAIVARVQKLHAQGRPVLVGTRSVAASDDASAALKAAGLEHAVLNAKEYQEEAEIVACAGQAGHITVATNMAGRGVDIDLGVGVADSGGLHVILSERHDAKRIDRQLEGRTARRGEPGSSEAILSLEDSLLAPLDRPVLRKFARLPGGLGQMAARRLFKIAQKQAEKSHARARRILLDQDRRLGTMLAFIGKPE